MLKFSSFGINHFVHRANLCCYVHVSFSTAIQGFLYYEFNIIISKPFIRRYSYFQLAFLILNPLTSLDMFSFLYEINSCNHGAVLTNKDIISSADNPLNYPPPTQAVGISFTTSISLFLLVYFKSVSFTYRIVTSILP